MFEIKDDDIKISRGDSSGTFSAALTDADGQPYELQPGDTLVLRVKKRVKDESAVVEITADSDMQFEFTPAHTEDLKPGLYKYQLCLRSEPDSVFRPISVHNFIIEEVV